MAERLRKIPVEVWAEEWTGENPAVLHQFTGGLFRLPSAEERRYQPELTGYVYDVLHSTWVGVKTGQSVIRGVRNECYPIDRDVLAETYERVPNKPRP